MSDNNYLKRLFQAYYSERQSDIPILEDFERREFGFIPWEKQIMIRHTSFNTGEDLKDYLIKNGPRHMYNSGTLYKYPDNLTMKEKGYQGCDFLIDIDVDHFYTPCKSKHDTWYCKECGASGKGMPKEKCPKCKKSTFSTQTWICEECLDIAKREIIKLIDNFLVPDFGFDTSQFKIAFSGHRGYHLKIEDDIIRQLSSEDRREIVDYVTGHNISLDVLGLKQKGNNIHGLLKDNIGWSHKIISKIQDLLKGSNLEIECFLRELGLHENVINSFLESKNGFLDVLSKGEKNYWIIPNFGLKTWQTFLYGIIEEVGAEIDEPVSIDIHRLIRYPGSLHGKSGFKVQEISIDELDDYDPLDESNPILDPIVFASNKTQKLQVLDLDLPITKIKGHTYGPYEIGEIINVPNHIAVFLLCKGVVKIL